jgi:uroporphyrinogen-III synthase
MSRPAIRALSPSSDAQASGPARIWVTRAQPGADRSAERLTALGFTPVVMPLLEIRRLDVQPDLTGVDALVFTSINGVSAYAALSPIPGLPVFTVGEATARAARDAGFTKIRSADGDVVALAALIRDEAAGLSLLHLGAAEPAGDLAGLVGTAARVAAQPLYRAVETHASPPGAWDLVLLHSPRAARALAASLPAGAATDRIAVAISPAAGAPLDGLGLAEIRLAATPDETGMLAALGKSRTSV